MTIKFPTEHIVNVKNVTVTITGVDSWPVATQQRVYEYGLRQILADAAAPAKTDAERFAFIEKRAANLQAGLLRSITTRESDPVRAEAVRMAMATIEAALRAKGKKVSEVDKKALRDTAMAHLKNNLDTIMAAAKEIVDRRGSVKVEVDLGDLI